MGPFRELVPWEARGLLSSPTAEEVRLAKSTLAEKLKVPGPRPHRQRNEDEFWQPHRSFHPHVAHRGGWSASESPRDGEGWGVRGHGTPPPPETQGALRGGLPSPSPSGITAALRTVTTAHGNGACGQGGGSGSGNRRRGLRPWTTGTVSPSSRDRTAFVPSTAHVEPFPSVHGTERVECTQVVSDAERSKNPNACTAYAAAGAMLSAS